MVPFMSRRDADGPRSQGEPEGATGADEAGRRRGRTGSLLRGVAVDITPLRTSREFRLLWIGQIVSLTGRQITVVALQFQVFVLTGSSLAVGMIGLAQMIPLILFSLTGGAIADRVDRRRLILVTEVGLAATSALFVAGAVHGHPSLWFLYAVTGLQSGILGVNSPTRSAAIASVVPREQLPAAMALNQVMFTTTLVVGPVVAGVVLGAFADPRLGLTVAYVADVVTFLASIGTAVLLRPLPPHRDEHAPQVGAWHAIKESLRFVRGRRVLVSTFLIDLDAMIFGMPRALFPVLALRVFKTGARGLGLLNAAPAAGALIAALTAGWVGRIKHQGKAVIWAVALWGAAITAFGLSGKLFWLALFFLAFAGAADVISAVFRGTILQLSVPDSMRGRLSAIHILVVTGGPRLGDVEAGVVAALVSTEFSVVSGGIACLIGALVLAVVIPELARYHAGEPVDAAAKDDGQRAEGHRPEIAAGRGGARAASKLEQQDAQKNRS
jgi:MFS family permease